MALIKRVPGLLRRHRWLPALVWTAAILGVSSLPKLSIGPPLFPGCDKIAHLIEYFILGLTVRFWVEGRGGGGRRDNEPETAPDGGGARPGLRAVLAGIGFAGADEIHQRFIPGRNMSLQDFLADSVGFTLGYSLGRAILGRLFGGEAGEASARTGSAQDGGVEGASNG